MQRVPGPCSLHSEKKLLRCSITKIQLGKCEDLTGFINQFMIWAWIQVIHVEGFYRKECETGKLLAKERVVSGRVTFPPGEEPGSYPQIPSSSFVGRERVHGTGYLLGSHQNIPQWVVRTAFRGEVGTAVRLGMKSWHGDLAYVISFWLVVFFLTGTKLWNQHIFSKAEEYASFNIFLAS